MNIKRPLSAFVSLLLLATSLSGCTLISGFVAGAGAATYVILTNKK